jgi:polar amino acid transport system substrate-binding protein/cystine transport system substrate-binding protein/membrane-bound lytic murein transglycosylase F
MLRRLARELGGLAVVFGLMLLVNFLPPDTSLSEVEATHAIRACVPTTYPPLVTDDPDRPGIDIEILRAVAHYIGVELVLNPSDAIGRDFNPSHWDIHRGKCEVLAGGVVDSTLTRSFLDTGPPYAETGWAIMAPAPLQDIRGRTLGALTILSGLDRIGLASYLRSQGVTVRVVREAQELVDGIANGAFDGGITEALLAGQLAADNRWWFAFLPQELPRYNLVFGLWKGDLTLKRKIVQAFHQLESDGTLAASLKRYGAPSMGQSGSVPTL